MTETEKLKYLLEELQELERDGHDLVADEDGYLRWHTDGCHGCLANSILSRLFEYEMTGVLPERE